MFYLNFLSCVFMTGAICIGALESWTLCEESFWSVGIECFKKVETFEYSAK